MSHENVQPIAQDHASSDYRTDWPSMIQTAFGAKGVVATSFWLGSLFAEQIRAKDKSFPFLEIVGEAGASTRPPICQWC